MRGKYGIGGPSLDFGVDGPVSERLLTPCWRFFDAGRKNNVVSDDTRASANSYCRSIDESKKHEFAQSSGNLMIAKHLRDSALYRADGCGGKLYTLWQSDARVPFATDSPYLYDAEKHFLQVTHTRNSTKIIVYKPRIFRADAHVTAFDPAPYTGPCMVIPLLTAGAGATSIEAASCDTSLLTNISDRYQNMLIQNDTSKSTKSSTTSTAYMPSDGIISSLNAPTAWWIGSLVSVALVS